MCCRCGLNPSFARKMCRSCYGKALYRREFETEKPRHVIGSIDPNTKRGVCAVCGPVDISPRKSSTHRGGVRWACLSGTRPWFNDSLNVKFSRKERVDLLNKQGGVCAICAIPISGKNAHTDHCHSTKEVRGILCRKCNLALGHVRDSTEVLRAMIKYLEGGER